MPNVTAPPSPPPDPDAESKMATPRALKAAKKELRTFMKAKLSEIPQSALETQSMSHPEVPSKAAFQALLALRQYKHAKRISVYLSMPTGEIQTDEIVRHALISGKEVFVPYLHKSVPAEAQSGESSSSRGPPKKVMDMVRLRGMEDYEGLERDAWGIPTVPEVGVEGRERVLGGADIDGMGRKVVSLNLMLIPGVAFEVEKGERGVVRRLGHGRGFYDYFLHRYRSFDEHGIDKVASKRMELFGLVLKEQLLKDGKEPHVPTGPQDSPLDGLVVGDGQIIESAPME